LLRQEEPGYSCCYSGHGDAFVPHLRKDEHACQDRDDFPGNFHPNTPLLCHGGLEFVFTNGSSHWILRGVNPVTIVLVKDIQLSEIGVLYPRLLQSERPQHALVSVLVFQTQSEIAGYERMKLMDPTGVYTNSIEKKATSDANTRKKSHASTAPVSLARISMVFGRVSEEVRSKIT
jgi:hypothetical protein